MSKLVLATLAILTVSAFAAQSAELSEANTA
jgi:hypothetical protein